MYGNLEVKKVIQCHRAKLALQSTSVQFALEVDYSFQLQQTPEVDLVE